jgi:glucan 1,4-alpha-glucosidase
MAGLSAVALLSGVCALVPEVAAHSAAASAAEPSSASSPSGAAPGGPGRQSYLDTSRKDCFGTARNTVSKAWYTVADGVLSDVYSPTIENTNVSTMQFIVTDGATFADLQQRNMTYTVSSPDPSGMVCQVTSTDSAHGFQLVTDYLTDPARDSVVMHARLMPLAGHRRSVSGLKVYVRYDATVDNSGGGGHTNAGANNAKIDPATTALVSSDTRTPAGPFAAQVTGALVANRPFLAGSSGFVGTPSDGLEQLDTYHRLTHAYRSATNGNVVQTAEVDAKPGHPFTLALGFGPGAPAAIRAASGSVTAPFNQTLADYVNGWRNYDRSLHRPPAGLPGLPAAADGQMRARYWLSANVLKADEDKTYAGAFVASPTDPWGQSVPATTTHSGWTYREVFARDSYETFTGLLADGDISSARGMVTFLYDRTQQANGSFPRNSLLDGAVAPDTFGLFEIDEDAYPLLMAWEAGFAGDVAFYQKHVRPDADFIVDHGPAYGVERWEEHPGYSPSTLAAEIAGLVAAAHLAQAAGDRARANLYLATADHYQRNVKKWTVTTTGPYAGHRYFIRLSPMGHPNASETYSLGNGSLNKVDQRSVIDAGFLELTRLGELPANDPDVVRSLGVVDSVLGSGTASGPGWHRYGVKANGSTDGYGDCYVPDPTDCSPTGAPWFPKAIGSGHLWALLDGERAEQDMSARDSTAAVTLLETMQNMSSGIGLVPEQAWEDPDVPASPYGSSPATASIGFTNGKAAGSASPLIWAQAQSLRLIRDLQTGTVLDRPAITAARYVTHGPPSRLKVSITRTVTSGGTTLVTGTAAPGATVDVTAARPASRVNMTSVVQTVAGAHGTFRVTIPTPRGKTVITAAASAGKDATGWAQKKVTVR